MKNNKNKLSAVENFKEDVKTVLDNYYKQVISKAVKIALVKKKTLSTCKNCHVKHCKV